MHSLNACATENFIIHLRHGSYITQTYTALSDPAAHALVEEFQGTRTHWERSLCAPSLQSISPRLSSAHFGLVQNPSIHEGLRGLASTIQSTQ
jgi:hypothetical protein